MKRIIYIFLCIITWVISPSYAGAAVNAVPLEYNIQVNDSMQYEITKLYTLDDLKSLVLQINKEHNALLSFTDLEINDQQEITGINLKFIDSQIQTSTYSVSSLEPIEPIIVYKYGDSISGIKKKEINDLTIPKEVLERISKQERDKKERDSLRKVYEVRKTQIPVKKPKIQVRSSHTVPLMILTEEQQELRKALKTDST